MSINYKLKFYYMKFIYLVSNSCMYSHAYIVRMSLCYKLTCIDRIMYDHLHMLTFVRTCTCL